MRGDEEAGKIGALLHFLEILPALESIHVRHLEIEDDQVVTVLAVKLQDLAWIHRRCDGYISGGAQRPTKQKDVGLFISDQQDVGAENVGFADHHSLRPSALGRGLFRQYERRVQSFHELLYLY